MIKTFDSLLNFEINFIIYIQKLFNGPEQNLNLIKIGKIFTNNQLQSKLIIYSVILNLLINFHEYDSNLILIFTTIYNYSKINFILYLSKYINYKIKNCFKISRPYLENNKIENVTIKKDKSKSYSFPSNSIQNSFVFYSSILELVIPNSNLIYYLVYGIIIMLGIIKTIRGLHYLHDIISGLIIANIILAAYLRFM